MFYLRIRFPTYGIELATDLHAISHVDLTSCDGIIGLFMPEVKAFTILVNLILRMFKIALRFEILSQCSRSLMHS